MAYYFDETALALSVGGAAVLVQLLDKDGDGVADPALVAAIRARATSDMSSIIQTQLDLIALDARAVLDGAYPDALVYHTADIGAYYAWLAGGENQVMPPATLAKYEAAMAWADKVAKKLATLGTPIKPAAGQFVAQVDRNPGGDVWPTPTWTSMRGSFW